MNNFELSIVTLLHYNVIIRDTLEYAMYGRSYNVEAFNYKKRGVKIEIEQPTALKQFIEKNKEVGERVNKEINNLFDAIYKEDSTICHVSNNELRVDESQHIAIYDVVLPLHEDVKKIIDAHIGFARKNNLLSDSLMKLVVADERMYRAVCFTALYRDLEKLFVDYNKARNEAKGEITPQSNFIQGELIKVTNHIKYVIQNQSATDVEYWDIVDIVNKTIEQTSGRRQLPEGKTFRNVFEEGNEAIRKLLTSAESKWKELYEPAINELLALSKKNDGQIKVNINEEKGKAPEASAKPTDKN